jgi:hypothetical protein
MAYTWRRASKAMLVTSSTTAFAFLASSFSKLIPIKSFGIFAATIIPMNYLLTITIYPALIIVHEKYFLPLCCKLICCKKKEPVDDAADVDENESEKPKKRIHKEEKKRVLEWFFGGPWNYFIIKCRFFIIFIVICWVGICIWRVTKLSALTKQE